MTTSFQISEFEAIGTSWSIRLESSFQESLKGGATSTKSIPLILQNEIKALVESYDKLYSRFRGDSIVTQIRRATDSDLDTELKQSQKDTWEFPTHALNLFSFYTKMEQITHGLFTPTIGNSLEEIGYDATYSLRPKKNSKLQHSLSFSDLTISQNNETKGVTLSLPRQSLPTKNPLLLDFGAAGKGQLVDLISDTITHSVAAPISFLVNGSGDIFHHGESAITVGLENPHDAQSIIGTVQIKNQALCGSAPNRRTWQDPAANSTKYHHILNPKTLKSPTHIAATWVLANNALEADGLATALFFVPAATLQAAFDFEYLILYTTGSVEKSTGFATDLYI